MDDKQPAPRVVLRQFDPTAFRSSKDTECLLDLWGVLQNSAVDAALTNDPSVFDFQDKCLYFATIHWPADTSGLSCAPSNRDANRYTDDDVDMEDTRNCASNSQSSNIAELSSQAAASDHLAMGPETVDCSSIIGVIYLLNLEHAPGEASLGLALMPYARNKGFGPDAVLRVLGMAFDVFEFHRISALVLDGSSREHALRMFVGLGFGCEGTRRRAVQCPSDAAWRDAHHLGMLDTEWVTGALRRVQEKPVRTRWDEMFERHQREREVLVDAAERARILKRTASTETLRPGQADLAADSEAERESASEAEAGSTGRCSEPERSVSPQGHVIDPFLDFGIPYRRAAFSLHSAYHGEESDAESDAFDGIETSRSRILRRLHSVFDSDSDEHDALLQGSPFADVSPIDHHGHLYQQQAAFVSAFNPPYPPPPESESEADISGDSEGEAEHYESALESDGDDELLLAPRSGRRTARASPPLPMTSLPTTTSSPARRMPTGSLRPREELKKRRVELGAGEDPDDLASYVGVWASGVVGSPSGEPVDLETSGPRPDSGRSAASHEPVSASSTGLQLGDVAAGARAGADAGGAESESECDTGSEAAWDMLSNASSLSEAESSHSLSLQSASDSE